MRSKNVALSVLSSFGYQIVITITNFILINLIISNYGSIYNGLNSSVQNVINYLNIVEAGIALSAIYSLYKPLAVSDWFEVNRIVYSADKMYFKSGIIFSILLAFVALLYPLSLNEDIPYLTVSLFITILGLSSLFEFFLNGKLRVLLMGDQKSYIVNFFQIISLTIAASIKIYMIINGFSFLVVMSIGSLLQLLRYFITRYYVKKNYPRLNYLRHNYELFRFESKNSVILHQIAGLVVFNSPLVLVSIFISLEVASIYAVYNLVFNGIFMLTTLLTKSSVSSFGNLLILEKPEFIKRIFKSFQSLFFTVGFALYTVTFIMFEPFIKLYLGEISLDYLDEKLLILFTSVGVLNIVRMPHNVFIEAAGHYKQTQYRALFEAILNIVSSIILVILFGIYGVLMGSILSFIYRTTDIIIYTSVKILKTNWLNTLYVIVANSIIMVVSVFFIKVTIPKYFGIITWIDWIICSVFVTTAVTIIFILTNIVVNKSLVGDLKNRINSLLKIKVKW